MIEILKCKLHGVITTGADKDYEGSILIDKDWMDMAGIHEFEKVHVWNRNNGTRHVTYAISGERGTGAIVSNGPAAHLVSPGDKLIIASFQWIEEARAPYHKPKIVLFDEDKKPYFKQY